MSEAFDNIAATYDTGYTDTATGRMQREIVWRYLDRFLHNKKNLNILELNCGTGEDAVWLASKGHKVLATDISEKMLEVAEMKAKTSDVTHNLNFQKLDISDTASYQELGTFDLVFSNFGGLNCIGPETFQEISPYLSSLLQPAGQLIAVIMSKHCAWESFYFTLKGKPKTAFRRTSKKPIKVKLGQNEVLTWYYSPSDIKKLTADYFWKAKSRAVGFFLPPSYLDTFFKKHQQSLQLLFRMEKGLHTMAVTAPFADHFLIDLEVKK